MNSKPEFDSQLDTVLTQLKGSGLSLRKSIHRFVLETLSSIGTCNCVEDESLNNFRLIIFVNLLLEKAEVAIRCASMIVLKYFLNIGSSPIIFNM